MIITASFHTKEMFNMDIIQYYAPTNDSEDDEDNFYKQNVNLHTRQTNEKHLHSNG
ncbi:hypothetical protein DPMN_172153 [Dreissena polymorpha]|uniref:Uncharacterized protein n=1 Tax=Dreissena polymorpha TaxID=45954 RepID=A0A9D4ID26_DREPO|nr:hypothetical protein DPMN_172153 [Dreissena polymorpha]